MNTFEVCITSCVNIESNIQWEYTLGLLVISLHIQNNIGPCIEQFGQFGNAYTNYNTTVLEH